MADELDQISKSAGSATGSELLGNLAANVVAGLGGALVGGTAGASTASSVQLYNQSLHQKRKDVVSQACPAGAQCSDAVLGAAIQAQGDLAQVAQNNVAGVSLATAAVVATAGGAVLLPEAYAAYKTAQAGYSLTTAALTGAAISGASYTAPIIFKSDFSSSKNFVDSFNQQFSAIGLGTAATVGAANAIFSVSMFSWAAIPNSIANVFTIPGAVIRANGLALGQAAGRAAQAAAQSKNPSK